MTKPQNGQSSPERREGPTQVHKDPWWRPWVAPGVILITIGLAITAVVTLFDIRGDLTRVEVDLGKQIHKESTEIRELVGENAKAIGKVEGEFSGLKRQVESMDRKLDRALEMRRGEGEGPSDDQPVKQSSKRH